MGIQGLLPQLKSVMSQIHIKELKGCCVAVDTYCWLHKGAVSCSTQLCKGIPTSRHIDYCMHRVNLLRHYGVKPILIFDGGFLPMKTEQENKRARSRKESLERAIQHESAGNSSAAFECYQKAVDISPAVAFELIQVLKREAIPYIVAPYEADAQMAFLAITRQVDAVITEDSDLIAFGCSRIIYKMDKFGQGVEFQYQKLERNRDLNFSGFSNDMLLEMCILSGCDYLPSLPGMGLKKAHALISKHKTYQKVIKHLKYSSMVVPPLYEESFKKAVWTFRHQRVYDTSKEDIVHLSDISEPIDGDLDFLGPLMPRHIAKAIAEGEVDPISKMPFQGKDTLSPGVSYQVKDVRTESNTKKVVLPVQKNLLTNYFCFASLEAKRKFSAPRSLPTSSDVANGSSPTLPKQVHQDPLDHKTNGLSAFPAAESVQTDFKSPHVSMETEEKLEDLHASSDGNLSRRSDLERSCRPIPKPCSVLRNGRSSDDIGHSYILQQNSEDATLRSSYILEKTNDDDVSRKSKKVVVRSAYFKHKARKTVDNDEKNNPSSIKDDSFGAVENEIIRPEINLVEDDLNKDANTKRKASSNQVYFEEHAENKLARTERYEDANTKRKPSSNQVYFEEHAENKLTRTERYEDTIGLGTDVSNDSDKCTEEKPEDEKFGCRISHLRQYSDISEKSLDKFVSVISSFKFSSSGSRASGLRAPLKDVKNLCPLRSTAPADIANFSYVPNNGKIVRIPSKRR